MTSHEIQIALKAKGITQSTLADRLCVSRVTVSDVINKRRISHRVMTAISEALVEDIRWVFPEYYLRPPKRKNSKVCTI